MADFEATTWLNDRTDALAGVTHFELYDRLGQGGLNKIKKQALPYWLEIVDGSKIEAYTFPRTVEGWQSTQKPRQSVTFTQGGLFQDTIGLAPPQIRINGTFGYALGAGDFSQGDAFEKYASLEGMIQAFYLRFGKYSHSGKPVAQDSTYYNKKMHQLTEIDPANPPTIRFYDFTCEDYWEVAIDAFTFSRSTQRRMLYMYDIQMTALKWVSPPALPRPYEIKRPGSIGAFLDFLDKAQELYNNCRNFLNAVNRLTDTVKGIILRCINFVRQIAGLIRAVGSTIKSIANIPKELARAWNSATKELAAALASDPLAPADFVVSARMQVRISNGLVKQTKNTTQLTQLTTTSAATPIGIEVADAALTPGSISAGFVSIATPPEADMPVSGTQLASIGSVIISDRDTITSIARKLNIDWQQIAMLNNLDYPYIVTDSRKVSGNVMRPGDAILIPGSATGSANIVITHVQEENLFGIDVKLDTVGAMAITSGDSVAIAGLNNLAMQLEHRLKTARGELAELGHPGYGSLVPTFIGKINSPVVLERIRLECELTLLQDPRVASVRNSTLNIDGTALYFTGEVFPINQTSPMQMNINLA